MVLTDLEPSAGTAKYAYTISTAPTGSGGEAKAPAFTLAKMSDILNAGATYTPLTDGDAADFVDAGKLIKDMGKSVVSGGRTYRKFALALTGAQFVSSLGVAGNGAAAPNTGYGSFYLEVGRDGFAGTNGPAPIVRYC